MESTLSKVYVRINEQGYIVACDGGYTTPEILDKWTKIDEGIGDRYNLAQSNYFDKPIVTIGGAYRYKLVNGKPVECTPEEIAEQETANQPEPTPSIPEEVEALKNENFLLKAQIQAMSDRNDFIEDCIAEMAMQVYA